MISDTLPRSLLTTAPALVVALCALLLSGCAQFQQKDMYEEEKFAVTITPRQEVSCPGEALIVDVTLRNLDSEEQSLLMPSGKTMSFYWMPSNLDNPLKRTPVVSAREKPEVVQLAPDQTVQRPFVFTNLTEHTGEFILQAIYRSPYQDGESRAMVVAENAKYKVEGEPLFTRGEDGMIRKQDAIRLAQEREKRPVNAATARTVRNEAGFFDWQVHLRLEPDASQKDAPAVKAYLINPYIGSVRQEIEPDPDVKFEIQ